MGRAGSNRCIAKLNLTINFQVLVVYYPLYNCFSLLCDNAAFFRRLLLHLHFSAVAALADAFNKTRVQTALLCAHHQNRLFEWMNIMQFVGWYCGAQSQALLEFWHLLYFFPQLKIHSLTEFFINLMDTLARTRKVQNIIISGYCKNLAPFSWVCVCVWVCFSGTKAIWFQFE